MDVDLFLNGVERGLHPGDLRRQRPKGHNALLDPGDPLLDLVSASPGGSAAHVALSDDDEKADDEPEGLQGFDIEPAVSIGYVLAFGRLARVLKPSIRATIFAT